MVLAAIFLQVIVSWWVLLDLNQRPLQCECSALTTELSTQAKFHYTGLIEMFYNEALIFEFPE